MAEIEDEVMAINLTQLIKDIYSRKPDEIKSLTPREEQVLKAYYGLGEPAKTLQAIGDPIQVTRERIRQIRNKATVHLLSNIARTYVGLPNSK